MSVVQIAKVDRSLGIIFGFAVVSTVHGQPFVDSQNDTIPEQVALEAFAKFAAGDRVLKLEHSGGAMGRVLFIFPLTADIAASLGIQTRQTGVIIGVKPDDANVLDRFERGELTGFSIGGRGEIEESE